ncbi:TPA: hypothetical protein ACPH2S_000050 [Pseudomonas aeruginosa]|uniref:hypothetical protein n=1 Tax=Pseudomonas aeruginosa TaxID=287 RepID=UPI002ACC6444|nr:hypothetical protein [Pseudomonas aeruginosa]HEN8225524.1 hypothetical protein [Pseudomonas aeruginosa]HEO1554979.1 hypothetical protein [Pseudomonas aeruginosa]
MPWVQIAILIASYVISAATAPKPKKPKPAAFSDFDFPQTEDGTEQYVIFGDCWIDDWIVLGAGNYRTRAIRTKGSKK